MPTPKKLAIIGSTGSIGTQALDIVRQNRSDFKIVTIAANQSIDILEAQIKEFQPRLVAVMNDEKAEELKFRLKSEKNNPKVISGPQCLIEAATHPEVDLVLTAIVGAIGIEPTHEAIKAGKSIALANKETLVAAGKIIMKAASTHGISIIPVDSEHSAIFQCLEGRRISDIEKIILTCSGGPFYGKTRRELAFVTPQEALAHPTWNMGPKISIDSATLVNKGLEVIEAHHLFGLPPEKIDVVIHPQSIIHSMVQFKDGNILAQLGVSDMRIPISYALYYPKKATNTLPRLNIPTYNPAIASIQATPLTKLTFHKPDSETFPGLSLAYEALEKGGQAPAIYNATNELAVKSFLNGEISFLDIPEMIRQDLSRSN